MSHTIAFDGAGAVHHRGQRAELAVDDIEQAHDIGIDGGIGFHRDRCVPYLVAIPIRNRYHRVASAEGRALVGTNSSAAGVGKQARGCFGGPDFFRACRLVFRVMRKTQHAEAELYQAFLPTISAEDPILLAAATGTWIILTNFCINSDRRQRFCTHKIVQLTCRQRNT